jgi:carboxymethylenebutenolidase
MSEGQGRLGRDVELGDAGRGYLAVPVTGAGPGVIVLQEWWGLVDHIRDVCDRLAREGFVAFAPDLYHGQSATDPGTAERLMMDLDIPRAQKDMATAVQALLGHDAVEGAKLGCIGFCMGGQLALCAGSSEPRIGAVVDCYGVHPRVAVDFSRMQAAVLGVFAENDAFVPPEAVSKLRQTLADAGVRAQLETYLGVDHAFLNDSRPDVYDAATAREAWSDILSFLRAELS